MGPKSKEGCERQINALIRAYQRDFSGGGTFGYDWPTFRINDPTRYERVRTLQNLWRGLPSRRKLMASNKVETYIRSIRNAHKRSYAQAYWKHYTTFPLPELPPDHPNLSVMGAQAVRIQIHHLVHQKD